MEPPEGAAQFDVSCVCVEVMTVVLRPSTDPAIHTGAVRERPPGEEKMPAPAMEPVPESVFP